MTGGSADAPAWKVVLDANILLQAPIRDTILRLAEAEVLAVYWSDEILAEVERNFASVTGHADATRRAQHLLAALRSAFSEATIYGYEDLIPTLPIALHDRHVLACAITATADCIITYNVRHFPARHLAPYRVEAWHPDRLLGEVLDQRPGELLDVLFAQGEDLHPPRSLLQVLDGLANDLPRFAARVRQRFGLP